MLVDRETLAGEEERARRIHAERRLHLEERNQLLVLQAVGFRDLRQTLPKSGNRSRAASRRRQFDVFGLRDRHRTGEDERERKSLAK